MLNYGKHFENYLQLNKEYDFVTKGKQVASAAAVLSDTAIEKLEELNTKVFFYLYEIISKKILLMFMFFFI